MTLETGKSSAPRYGREEEPHHNRTNSATPLPDLCRAKRDDASEPPLPVAASDFLELQENPSERAWNEFLAVIAAGQRIITSKAEHDKQVIVSVARLYECRTSDWSYFLSTKKIGIGRPAKSEFHHIVVYALNAMGDKTGRSTVVCAVLDEWVSTKPRPAPDEIPAWMKAQGGRDEIYKCRRDRERDRPTRDERDAAVHELITLPPIATTPLPAALAGLDGDHPCARPLRLHPSDGIHPQRRKKSRSSMAACQRA